MHNIADAESKPELHRYTDAELHDLETAPAPVEKMKIDPANLDPPEELDARLRFFASIPPSVQDELRKRREELAIKRTRFLLDEGVLAVVQDDRRARNGIDFAEAAGASDPKHPACPPTFILTSA